MTSTNTPEASQIDRFPLVKLGYAIHLDQGVESPSDRWYWTMTRDGLADIVASDRYFTSEAAAWTNADEDARAAYPEAWFEAYYLTRVQVDVISETGEVPEMDLATIAREMIAGDFSGTTTVTGHWRLCAAEAAAELEAQGSDAAFFSALAEIDERSRFMRPSPAKAFAQGVLALLEKHAEAAKAGRPVRLDAKLLLQLMVEAAAVLNSPV
jgi:hypothetical protein